METISSTRNDCKQIKDGIVLACSGGSDLGELTDKVARKLRDNKVYNMKCLAMVAADNKGLIETLQKSEVLVIDGCNIDCGKKIMEEAWLSNYQYIRLTDLGYVKGKTAVTDDRVNSIYERIVSTPQENRIIHEKMVLCDCDSAAKCDIFDFMANHVGFTVIHPGGFTSTNRLLDLLKIDKTKKVLDLACGKGTTSILIAKKYGCKVISIDISEKLINEAKILAKKAGVESLIEFHIGDITNLPFKNEEFDVVVAQAILILVNDKEKAISEAARVLMPGGNAGFLELTWQKEPSNDFLDQAANTICGYCMLNAKDEKGWVEIFNQSGFKEINHEVHSMKTSGFLFMLKNEGLSNTIRIFYKYFTNKTIRRRMIAMDKFFITYADICAYGIYTIRK